MKDFELKQYGEFSNPDVHKSLMNTSADTIKTPIEYMTDCKHKVIDFDEVKKRYLVNRDMHEGDACSVDALYKLKNDKLCMVEFKNGDFTSSEIIEKALSSAIMFADITGKSMEFIRDNIIFVLVYNGEIKHVNWRQKMASGKAKRAKIKIFKFDIDHLYKFCFLDVVEIEKDEFDKSIYVRELEGY
jgi:hypothetical protein